MRERWHHFIGPAGKSELFVEDGRIVPPGPADAERDLGGAHLLPGFVDCHCHILPTGLDLLRPTLAGCASHEEVLDRLRDALPSVAPGAWLRTVHYDQTRFPDAQHLTRADLDPFGDTPILLRHTSGHASVANSACLRAAGIDETVEDPVGGTFVRDADGRLTGVLLERAHEIVTNAAPKPDLDQCVEAILRAGHAMSAFGITAATDMMTGFLDLPMELEAYRLASERGCPIRLRLCLQWSAVFGPGGIDPRPALAAMNPDRCRAVAIKLFADGAIGSATAAVHGRFPDGGQGTLIYPPERLLQRVRKAHESGWPVRVHAIGDRAVDVVMDAFEATGEPRRHLLEHAMILSDAQIERIARAGLTVTMQPEFLVRFGHAYRRQLPAEAPRLKRVASLLAAGVPVAFSSDRPIVEGNPWTGILAAVERPEGFDPTENIPMETALRLYTEAAAAANGDLDQGHLRPGAWADLQVVQGDLGPTSPRQVAVAGVFVEE